MPKTCLKCGAENSDTAKFCKQCAEVLRGDSAARCPNGHIIAPGQTKCPICAIAEEGKKGDTFVEDPTAQAYPPKAPTKPQSPGGVGRGGTQVLPTGGPGVASQRGATGGGAGRGSTMVIKQGGAGVGAPQEVSDRKIVAALVTYSTRPDGQIFALREGRNRIGRNPENEVVIPDDNAMSGLNTFIIFHPQGKKQFVIDDANSQNGTFVNGEIVEERTRLPNYSQVRAGSTVFTFIAVTPEGAAAASREDAKEGSDGSDMSNV